MCDRQRQSTASSGCFGTLAVLHPIGYQNYFAQSDRPHLGQAPVGLCRKWRRTHCITLGVSASRPNNPRCLRPQIGRRVRNSRHSLSHIARTAYHARMYSPQRRRPGLCVSLTTSWRPGLYLLSFLLLVETHVSGQDKIVLQNYREALVRELDQVKTSPDDFYLIIDIPSKQIHLKAQGNVLRTCAILSLSPIEERHTYNYRFVNRIDPISVEPGNANLRLRGRLFPLDFSRRLIEGPRHRSRLYFAPNLVIRADGVSTGATPHITLSPVDIKALGSALRPGNIAIFIPHVEANH